MCSIPRGMASFDESPQPFVSNDGGITLMFEGKIHNVSEIAERLGPEYVNRSGCSGESLVHLYQRFGEDFLDGVNGKFAFALWDDREQRLLLGRDQLGIESLFYAHQGGALVFGSSLKAIMATGMVGADLNPDSILQYLLYCYNPADETVVKGVSKLPAGHTMSIDGNGSKMRRYWHLSFAETEEASEERYREEVIELMRDAIRIRLEPDSSPGIFLSGGTDSSGVLSLTSEMYDTPVDTFSFRCEGKSYDESSYARFVADKFGANHTEIDYGPSSIALMSDAVKAMDEPFSDIGIEVATFLLGKSAQGKVSYVFSGEGGDELFAGHPVYVADKIASFVDLVPKTLMSPIANLLQRLPDSDEKRNIQVKLKRFSYSLSFPKELLSHRWRIYYTRKELGGLFEKDFMAQCDLPNMYEGMARHSRDADGKDQLSRSLYSDYQTLVDFYMRRLGLLRHFNIESRLPLMDLRLVEYASRVPSKLKIKGMSDTKYIYRKILEGTVPMEILYDRPKLGHSVPMKNWLRDDPWVTDWVSDLLFDGAISESGFFNRSYLEKMVRDHRSKAQNNSHRLWGLSVLGLWMEQWKEFANAEKVAV